MKSATLFALLASATARAPPPPPSSKPQLSPPTKPILSPYVREVYLRAVDRKIQKDTAHAEWYSANGERVLTRMLDTCIREPHAHLAVFVMQRGGRGHLDFIQNMEYKFVELLSCAFVASDDETVRQSIAFRYNAVKSRLALMQARLQDINALVKIKNPSLLLQLQRAPPRFPGSAASATTPAK